MDSRSRREGQSLRRPSEVDEQRTFSRSTQTLETSFNGLQESGSHRAAGSSEPRHGSPRNNLVTESGYSSIRNTNSTSEGGAGIDSSNSSLGEASGYDESQATFLKSGDLEELSAASRENDHVRGEQSDFIEILEVTPVEASREIAQETGDQLDVEQYGSDGSVADIPTFPALPPQDIDLRHRRNFHRGGRLVRCFTCFRWPVAVQNWPCGCICNCLECADHMTSCSQCSLHIYHYTRIG